MNDIKDKLFFMKLKNHLTEAYIIRVYDGDRQFLGFLKNEKVFTLFLSYTTLVNEILYFEDEKHCRTRLNSFAKALQSNIFQLSKISIFIEDINDNIL